MLNSCILSNTYRRFPVILAQRFRVRNLPKERYGDHETPFVEGKKPGKTFTTNFFAIAHRKNITLDEIKSWRNWKKIDAMREDQMFLPERHQVLGPNLATAHFICARGGKVKFKGSKRWITQKEIFDNTVPNTFHPGYYIEEIDASGTDICYEGFENFCDLAKLKKLYLKNCPFVDDWCLSRTHLFKNSLLHLDVSGCENITERGICALHPLRALKTLVIENTPNLENKELVCLLLQDVIPNLEFIGVNFDDPELLKSLESTDANL